MMIIYREESLMEGLEDGSVKALFLCERMTEFEGRECAIIISEKKYA